MSVFRCIGLPNMLKFSLSVRDISEDSIAIVHIFVPVALENPTRNCCRNGTPQRQFEYDAVGYPLVLELGTSTLPVPYSF